MSERLLVITPTYNERENLERLVERLLEILPAAHILVVDDDSPDGTGALADVLAARDDRIEVLHRPSKLGLASAYIEGFRLGLEAGFDVIVQMDADLSHDPKYLPDLLAALENGADLAIGSRRVPGGGIKGWPARRRLLSRGANLYARTILAAPVRDLTSGFRAMRRTLIENVDLDTVRSEGYSFLIEMGYRAVLGGARVVEVPIVFRDRRQGSSKLGLAICLEAVVMVPLLRFRGSRMRSES